MRGFLGHISADITTQKRWTIDRLPDLISILESQSAKPVLDGSHIEALDTAGAWLIIERQLSVNSLKPEHQAVFDLVQRQIQNKPSHDADDTPHPLYLFIENIGKSAAGMLSAAYHLISFIGETVATLFSCLLHPSRLRFDSINRHIRETGINAIPIVSLMAFLISIVLTYQGADQLKKFGAELFTINMLAISLLREMGVLLTAIMVAGRSGSAFTAEIGVMKVNQEVDAMRIIGLGTFDVLVLPRFMALLVTLPLLALVANIAGSLGGMLIAKTLLGISPMQYIEQFKASVDLSDFWVGISKAPVFALLISVVGCMRGLEVSGSAESVGRLTTVSVVQSIFLVLLADALFSILFTKMGW